MTDTPITPALTPEQWETTPTDDIDFGDGILDSNSRHSAAALCLYGQPFGFDRNDLRAIQRVVADNRLVITVTPKDGEEYDVLERLAAKISALLPPQPPIVAPSAAQGPA